MLQLALDVGFWNRLMGGLSVKGLATVGWVQSLASSLPTSVQLDRSEALRILNMAKLARTAGENWLSGMDSSKLIIPKLSMTPYPNINGGEPGRYNFGVIIKPPTQRGMQQPLFFSDNKITEVDRVIGMMREFMEETGHATTSYGAELKDIITNWTTGRRDAILSHGIWEHITRTLSGD